MEHEIIILANSSVSRMLVSSEQYNLLTQLKGSSKCIHGFIFLSDEDLESTIDFAIKTKLNIK